MNQKPKDFYVYLHRRATDGKVFYVGKGRFERAYKNSQRTKHWNNIVSKHGYTVEIYLDGLQEWYAFELEKEMISYYGRENLCNMTDGGDGISNPSEETRLKMSQKAKNRGKISEETRLKISNSSKGRVLDEKTRIKMSEARIGIVFSIETIKKMSINSSANRHEVKIKMSESRKKNNHMYQKKVKCNELFIDFESITHACDFLMFSKNKEKVSKSHIGECCSGKRKSAYGYTWSYA